MFSSLTNSGLLGIPLALLVVVGVIKFELPGTLRMENARRPGDGAPAETPAGQVTTAPATFREFSSPEELAAWAKHTVESYKEQDKIMPPIAPKLISTSVWDCDDYSERLQRKALSDGYLISIQLITNGSLLGARVTNYVSDHMGNLTIIGNNMYYIEPLDGHVALVGPKD